MGWEPSRGGIAVAKALVEVDAVCCGKAGRRFGGLDEDTWGLKVTLRGGLVAIGEVCLWRSGVVSDGAAAEEAIVQFTLPCRARSTRMFSMAFQEHKTRRARQTELYARGPLH